jgi:hypothetical protein
MFKLGLRSIVMLLAIICVAGIAYAKSGYLTDFTATYGASAGGSCLTCHTSGSTRNAYGSAFGSANHVFAAIEGLDSDGDGFTNIAEINAGTFPGDAASHPAPTPPPPPPAPAPTPTPAPAPAPTPAPAPAPTPAPAPAPTPAPAPAPSGNSGPVFDAAAFFAGPTPQITANGQTGWANVSTSEPVTIAVTVDAGYMAGRMCDWWVTLSSPFGLFSYVFPSGWQGGLAFAAQAPLFDLSDPYPVLNLNLPAGEYTFFLAVDDNADGVPDGTYMDYVTVTVN